MKKIATFAAIFTLMLSITTSYSTVYAADSNLISNMQTTLKNTETPKRLEASFDLNEAIDLSQGNSNIIFEYYANDSSGNSAVIYKKDKTWSGYLNSYDNYPSGERKYSSGSSNSNYPDAVPSTKIFTSVKTGTSIDVAQVTAVKITVLRADGSGEKVTVYNDGSTSAIEKINVPITLTDKDTGIILKATTAELPAGTVLIANELTSQSDFEQISALLTDAVEFIAFDIKLEADGKAVQPNGKIKISIKIPDNFNSSQLVVYRIDSDNAKTPYAVNVTTKNNIKYAEFETDHFTTYVLADESNIAPNTGDASTTVLYCIIMAFAAVTGVIASKKTKAR